MPQKNSPPPTPVSSPRVSPTPPGSPKAPGENEELVQTHGLSPSNIPLRPVSAPETTTTIINVDPAPIIPSSSTEEMDIDDTGSDLSPTSSPNRNVPGATGEASTATSDQDWSTDDWMVDMRRVKARLQSFPTPGTCSETWFCPLFRSTNSFRQLGPTEERHSARVSTTKNRTQLLS